MASGFITFSLTTVLFPRWAPTAPCYLLVAKFSRLSEMLFRAVTAVLCSDRPCLLVPLEKPSLLFQVQLDCNCLLWSLPCPRDKLVTYSFVPTLYPGHRKNPKTLNTLSYVGRPYSILDSDGLGQNLCYAALWPLAIHLTPESLNFIICKMGIINTTQRVKWGTTLK